ncbi:MAG: metallophosphoesterase family protein [Kiritimatiellia bacterium]
MSDVSRRGFIGSVAAVAGTRVFGRPAANLTLGVLSDIHVRSAAQIPVLEKAFAFFRDAGADGVIVAGDMADTGLVDQLELIAAAWFRVFPDGKAPDGRAVERLFVYGNHDVSDYAEDYLAKICPNAAERPGHRVNRDPKGNWEKYFREPWQGVYAKQVKGYTFIGAHWGYEKDLAAFLRANAERLGLRGGKPFFYAQHPHPGGTVQGPWAWGHDRGVATRALAAFPNAVAFSGHSHYSHTDERCVWQGAFTSIGTSSLSYIFAPYHRENGETHGERVLQMPCLRESAGKQGLLVRVYDACLVLERREFVTDEKTGPDWVVPLDGSKAFAFATRGARMVPPEFPAGAKVAVSCGLGKDRNGRETEQVRVSFPPACASATSRVYDYEVRAVAYREDADYEIAVRRVLSTSFHLPPAQETTRAQTCLFAKRDLLGRGPVRFVVRPTECYGGKGREISSELLDPGAADGRGGSGGAADGR